MLKLQTLHRHQHPGNPRQAAVLQKTRREKNAPYPEFLPSAATSSPPFPQGREPCLLTPTEGCASCPRMPGRGSATSSWGLTTLGKKPRARRPSWFVALREEKKQQLSIMVHLMPKIHMLSAEGL